MLKTIEAINSFLNPFDVPDKEKLFCISSGAPVSAVVQNDVLTAEEVGKKAKETCVTERLAVKKEFFAPVKEIKLKTFQTSTKNVKLKTTQNKVITYKQHISVAI